MRRLAAIVALNDAGVIGRAGALPWHIPEDLKHFRRVTMGHAILMGRRTHDSIGKALPGRRNLVLSRSEAPIAQGAERVADDALPMVIGGAEIYRLAMPQVTELFLTEVHRQVEGDAHFPEFDRHDFEERSRRPAETETDVEFVHLVRRRS
ncbi:MAG: dihydrofolate reductase [Deltaproteobacteria bacterium]|nr:dihydrofolate reductase [Deltaproteobacteria bacterium]